MSIKVHEELSYKERVTDGVENDFMRQAVSSAQERLKKGRLQAAEELGDWEDWRSLGEEIRSHTIEHLDFYLHQLSEQVEKNGGHVFFAQTAEEANDYIKNVVKKKDGKKVVKSKSMVSEEISLNEALTDIGAEVVESDLGEWILQLDDDPPSHIVAPALHKDREGIRQTFADKKGYDQTNKPEELAL